MKVFNQHSASGTRFCKINQRQNELDIHNINAYRDTDRNMLVLLMESNIPSNLDANPFVNGNNLLLEAVKVIELNKPYKTHLLNEEERSSFEEGLISIGFTEFNLKKGYKYSIISWQLMQNGLIKINLHYHPVKERNNKQYIN